MWRIIKKIDYVSRLFYSNLTIALLENYSHKQYT